MTSENYILTRESLLRDIYIAYDDARRHKAKMPYVRCFERNLKANLESLCDDLFYRTYKPLPSLCFIVDEPKKREVFAAKFRDRIVHHLYYNYTRKLFERTFIADSYSCIEGRGTHYGIDRLKSHILKESQNYTVPCWVLKMDIRGYFIHIDRQLLSDIAVSVLYKMADHRTAKDGKLWREVIDMGFAVWLTREIAMLDPKKDCERTGSISNWDNLDRSKSLFFAPDGCGLPIGNLTSQLFSNVYLNVLDQWMKRELGCQHYGRYVDDFYVVSCDRDWLLSLIPQVRTFLRDELHLNIHEGKTAVCDVRRGVEFLGAYVLPYRTYIANKSLQRMKEHVHALDCRDAVRVCRSVNSWLGTLCHYNSYNIRRRLFAKYKSVALFNLDMTKMFNP